SRMDHFASHSEDRFQAQEYAVDRWYHAFSQMGWVAQCIAFDWIQKVITNLLECGNVALYQSILPHHFIHGGNKNNGSLTSNDRCGDEVIANGMSRFANNVSRRWHNQEEICMLSQLDVGHANIPIDFEIIGGDWIARIKFQGVGGHEILGCLRHHDMDIFGK